MYRKLLPLLNRFVLIRQGMLGRAYMGRVADVDQETIEIQTYHPDGTSAELWTVNIATITEFLTESRQLDTLALKVKWANSRQPEDETAALPMGQSAESAS